MASIPTKETGPSISPLPPETAPELKNEHKNYFGLWCEMTGWHGVLECYVSKNPFWKIVWLLLVLGGCFLAISQSISMIMDFCSSDQWVASVTYDVPKDGKMEWPNMTVCGLDWIGELWKRHEDEYGEIEEEDDIDICPSVMIGCGNDYPRLTSGSTVCCPPEKGTRLKNCFKLNPSNASFRRQNVKNRKSDERIYYLLKSRSSLDNRLGSGYQVTLYLGESDEDDDYSSAFYVSPGSRSLLTLAMERHQTSIRKRAIQFYTPDLPCGKKFVFLNDSKYSRESCFIDCRIQFDAGVCKCASQQSWNALMKRGFRRKILPISRCAVNQSAEEECEDRYTIAIDQLLAGDDPNDDPVLKLAACNQECPELCEYSLIDAKISTALLISPSNVQNALEIFNEVLLSEGIIRRNVTVEELRQMIMLELYYESRMIKVFERMPRQSIDEFISNIGGCLGVWSGLSLLSIVQILIYAIRAMTHYLGMARLRRREKFGLPG